MQTNSRRTKTINSKIIALNEATDRLQDPHLHLFLAGRFLSRTNVQKNRAHVANHAVDGVLPFLICFEASENQSNICCLHGKFLTISRVHAACIAVLEGSVTIFHTYFEGSLRRH